MGEVGGKGRQGEAAAMVVTSLIAMKVLEVSPEQGPSAAASAIALLAPLPALPPVATM